MKTKDGIKINRIIKVAKKLEGITIRKGTNHYHILNYPNLRPCPVADSTDARKNIVPWIQEITNYSSSKIYTAFRRGKW